MSIIRSFNVGISGLGAMGEAVSVTSDNIANARTTGFKAARPEFQNILAGRLGAIGVSGSGGEMLGGGTKLTHIKESMLQGDIARTENLTDLAIRGDGFFLVKTPFGPAYTRDGSMHFNKDGKLVSSDGHLVQCFVPDDDGKLTSLLGDLFIDSVVVPAKATKEANIYANLDSRAKVLEFDINSIDKTSNFTHGVTVYDDNGQARYVTLVYNKTRDNLWEYRVLVDGLDLEGGEEGQLIEAASGRLVFNNQGLLQEEIEDSNSFNFKGSSNQRIDFIFGQTIEEGGDGIGASTQYGSEAQVNRISQDGYSASNLSSLTFDDGGILVAIYDNGISRKLGQVAIAKFQNNEALAKIGNNLYRSTRKSGEATMGASGTGGRGHVLSRALELSNVDIAHELVELMTAQRNFTANVKSLTTVDEMLKDILSIKR